ncbi:hypothetical protein [Streptomyces wuyuanensis]|uniref:hypothetical protein n=1 Tax=Streptomyces wuyuanensis TaxID=1196353 RepID=UPI0036C069B2
MISEPELLGAAGVPAPRAGDTVAGGAGPSGDGRRPARSRRPWLWALGGAMAASAVWAGGLHAYANRATDLQGYRVSRNLCLDARFTVLGGALGVRKGATASVDEQPALDRAHCSFELDGRGKDDAYHVTVTYLLHKETDPGVEFDALRRPYAPDGDGRAIERADGIGERAHLVVPTEAFPRMELSVLDGPAELEVALSAPFVPADEDGDEVLLPDPEALMALKDHVIEDTRRLMARLRQPA